MHGKPIALLYTMKKLLSLRVFASVKSICVSALIILFSSYGHGQELTTRIYTVKDGLPSSFVFGTYQDKLGYLWVSSSDGLSRFDGKYFTSSEQSEGMPRLMDSRLRLWFISSRRV